MSPRIGYFIACTISKILREKNKETINKWFARRGVKFTGTGHYWINSNIALNEPHLISIGANTTIAGNVEFITHDNSISKVIENSTDLFGRIIIGQNCFIGARSVILYGVTLSDNIIVAAGSVVTKSILQSNVIVAGNPARIISTWDEYRNKSCEYAWDLNRISRDIMIQMHEDNIKLIER